jgi:prevent-host-death family protein
MANIDMDKTTSWHLQDAKARFSELVRKARSSGPQHVTVHGREAVVVISEDDYRCLREKRTGQSLVDLLANSPLKGVEIDFERVEGPVRDVDL